MPDHDDGARVREALAAIEMLVAGTSYLPYFLTLVDHLTTLEAEITRQRGVVEAATPVEEEKK